MSGYGDAKPNRGLIIGRLSCGCPNLWFFFCVEILWMADTFNLFNETESLIIGIFVKLILEERAWIIKWNISLSLIHIKDLSHNVHLEIFSLNPISHGISDSVAITCQNSDKNFENLLRFELFKNFRGSTQKNVDCTKLLTIRPKMNIFWSSFCKHPHFDSMVRFWHKKWGS